MRKWDRAIVVGFFAMVVWLVGSFLLAKTSASFEVLWGMAITPAFAIAQLLPAGAGAAIFFWSTASAASLNFILLLTVILWWVAFAGLAALLLRRDADDGALAA